MLPVDQRAAARSAKVIRRYVTSVAPERTAPPPEDPMRMQAWLGRVSPVPAPAAQGSSSKAADKQRRKTEHIKAVKPDAGPLAQGDVLCGHGCGILGCD